MIFPCPNITLIAPLTACTTVTSQSLLRKLAQRTSERLLFEKEEETPTPALIASARGSVLELGPGSGNQLSRYSKSQITEIYGVEPNTMLHPLLQANVKKHGLSDIYRIVPCGIEDFDRLRTYGLMEGSVDTVVCHQVLCGVPRPKEMVKACYRFLKPGGVMIVKEHVKAVGDPVTVMIQRMYQTIWPFFLGGCNLTRSTGDYILQAGEWSNIDQVLTSREDPLLVIPPFAGRFTKAG
ncbi:MAG: hypothetical protein OHK93_004903 [Ramalina farinacea]|uniref:Methyltransferase type 11 domain-containing protein n=1 Tax=Ramalina farinacea TaxID=258253 RepID=A0AA43QUZ2_9LECA|nr:hypothetical protein [Ramalina farinacea]